MNIKFLRTAIFTIALLFAAMSFGQQPQNGKPNINNFLQKEQTIRVTNGSVFANFADQKIAKKDILNNLNTLLKLDENYTFKQISQKKDEIGFTHTNFQVLYKGYPVDGRIIMFHEKDGLLKNINGNVAALKETDIQINITDNQAINIAKEHLGVTKVFKESTVQTVFIQNQTDNKYSLTKKVRVESFSPLVRYDVFIDAKTGEILKKISLIPRADVQGTAHTLFYGTQSIFCNQLSANSYQLYDNTRGIGTYNGVYWDPYSDIFPSSNTLYTNTTTVWSDNPALDVHWGIEKTCDYYIAAFNRNGYDGYGGEIYNIYNPVILDEQGFQFNAGAVGYGLMVYGRGGDYGYNPFVSLDCAGHEFTHMVVEENGNGGLQYQGESGALNESFADIFGTCIEFYALPNPNWTIGEDIYTYGFMRSMSNPKLKNQPDTYYGENWANTGSSYDNGGVHINSGVQNYWFYLLCKGGSGKNDLGNNYSVTAIGMEKAQKIAYRNLMNYLNPIANHVDSYNGSLQAAADIFGNPSAEYTAVKNAWYAVGIDENTIVPVTGCGYYPTYLANNSGTFDDGSGNENYLDNQRCYWVIAPPCASSVTLSFSAFDTEEDYDYVFIFDSYDLDNLLAMYSGKYYGNNMPQKVTSYTGIMIVYFETDQYVNGQGWTANYTSVESSNCPCKTVLTDASGTISDGSGNKNYSHKLRCIWQIAPPKAKSITLTFTEFDTEKYYDIVVVRDDENNTSQQFSGKTVPAPITVNSGKMSVIFITDGLENAAGWTADYTSTFEEEFKDIENTIYPNPANNFVNIQFIESQRDAIIEIYDMFGKLIQRHPKQNIPANTTQTLDIKGLPIGIYNINVISSSKNTNYKLMILR